MNQTSKNLLYERKLWDRGFRYIAGVDEAGRGPLAGPVVAAAVIFDDGVYIRSVNDSKKLSHQNRLAIYGEIIEKSRDFGVGIVEVADIDRINIHQAAVLAMQKAVTALHPVPQHVLIDGRPVKKFNFPQTAIVKGDSLSYMIGAASIIAKVVRDTIMLHYDREYPGYGFEAHKGYATREHIEALRALGPCKIHRRSFRVRALENAELAAG